MTRRRWIADEVADHRAALTGDHASHLSRVLRARVGQEFDIATPTAVRRGRITSITDQRVEFELTGELPASATPHITLLLSIFKFDRMEWAIEKCTEVGASRIIPVIAQRTASHLAAAAIKRRERWQRLAVEASEQSRRPAPPEIADLIKLKDAVGLTATPHIVLAESETQALLRDAIPSAATDLALAIGPEGGWTTSELKLFQAAGWTFASLGPTILRAETAAIAAVAIALSALQ
jgi:16S rRNA (uracil1498-N3)-methyltransferase